MLDIDLMPDASMNTNTKARVGINGFGTTLLVCSDGTRAELPTVSQVGLVRQSLLIFGRFCACVDRPRPSPEQAALFSALRSTGMTSKVRQEERNAQTRLVPSASWCRRVDALRWGRLGMSLLADTLRPRANRQFVSCRSCRHQPHCAQPQDAVSEQSCYGAIWY